MKNEKQYTLISPSIDELLERVDNKYILSLLAAKRARCLIDGDEPLIEQYHINKVTTAINEIHQGKVKPLVKEEENTEAE